MPKVISLASFAVVAALALVGSGALAQDRDFSKVEIKVTKVAGSVYMLEGAGGNIAASIGDDGIVIVDDQFAPLVEKIRAALKGISDKPLRFVVNTHYHGDHTGGNALFQKEAPVVAQTNVRKRLATGGVAGNLGEKLRFEAEPEPKDALPVVTFDHDLTLHLNGEEIRALHVPHGHTDGDSVILFTQSNVIHMGDDFVTYGFPFIDLAMGGSVRGLIDGLEALLPTLPQDVKVIPGHGPISTLDDVRTFIKMLKDTKSAVDAELAKGRTVAQMKEAKVLEPWQKYAGDFLDEEQWLITLVNEATGKAPGAMIPHN